MRPIRCLQLSVLAVAIGAVSVAAQRTGSSTGTGTGPASRPTTGANAAATKPATRPAPSSTRPAPPAKKVDPLRLAVSALQREAQQSLQQRKPFPRQTSDYFAAGPSIEPDALIKTLGTRLHQNPRIDAYIKFQLLSAAESFQGDQALPAMKAYVLASPAMIALPGVSQQEQQKWNQKSIMAKQEEIAAINAEWEAFLKPYEDANAIILAYRDLMKSRIRPTPELQAKFFLASLEDLSQRGAAGFDTDKSLSAASNEILNWLNTADRASAKDVATGLKEYTLRRPPKRYKELRWSDARNKSYWYGIDAGLDVKKVQALIDELEKHADAPPK